jgi:photosystem II stability/assembly factor-like uncharacterized protein
LVPINIGSNPRFDNAILLGGFMLFFSVVKMRPAGIALLVGVYAFAQQPAKQTGAPKGARSAVTAQKTEPKFKAIWEPVNVKDDIELSSVHFVTPEEGWVAGGRTGMQGGVILHTADAGANWEVQLGDTQSSDRAYNDLRFLGRALGWAVQSTGVGDHKLLRLDGKDWKDVGTVAQHRGDYRFVSAQVGFVASGGILRTQDGGRRWQTVYPCKLTAEVNGLSRNLDCEFAKLFFLNERMGWAISNAGASGTGFLLARTQDGGTTWESWVVLPGEDPREGSIYFTDPDHGALLSSGGKFFYSTDGGKSWTGATGQIGGKPRLEFADPKVGWAIRYQDMSYTVDGGKQWISRKITFPASAEDSSLVNPDSGYAVGAHGMVYRYRVVPIEYTSKSMLAAPAMQAKP